MSYLSRLPTPLPADFARPLVWGDRYDPAWPVRQMAAERAAAADNAAVCRAPIADLMVCHARDLKHLRQSRHLMKPAEIERERVRIASHRRAIAKWLRWQRHFEALMQEDT